MNITATARSGMVEITKDATAQTIPMVARMIFGDIDLIVNSIKIIVNKKMSSQSFLSHFYKSWIDFKGQTISRFLLADLTHGSTATKWIDDCISR